MALQTGESQREEWIKLRIEAQRLIDMDDKAIYDVALLQGQTVDNVKHMNWFIDAVAHQLRGDQPV